jgi:glycosyltransferase involved in cell wall biosynthesis
MTKDVSVMICTWNNSRRLAAALTALSQCIVPGELTWELIIVNNNCTDDTDRVVARFVNTLPIVYLRESRQGLSNARNAGLSAARGRLILFTDDDVRPHPRWIAAYWTAYQATPQGHYFGGPVDSEFEGGKPDEELLRVAFPSIKGLDWGSRARQLTKSEGFAGANWACPAHAFSAGHKFDTSLGLDSSSPQMRLGEETDLMMRLRIDGMLPWYLPDARLSHFVPASKCTLEHIAARYEAFGRYSAHASFARPRRPRTIWGWPRWLSGQAMKLCLKWLWARARGHKAYGEYMQWRHMLGMLKATRELLRSGDEAGVDPSRIRATSSSALAGHGGDQAEDEKPDPGEGIPR